MRSYVVTVTVTCPSLVNKKNKLHNIYSHKTELKKKPRQFQMTEYFEHITTYKSANLIIR